MVKRHQVAWDKPALQQLKEAYLYIRKDSQQHAENVRKDLLNRAASLSEHPLRYNADRLRQDNNQNYRSFELHHYRVSYFIDEAQARVVIVRLRHSSQEPLEY
jgi:addiction module RelE/StbE family toxin